jgi:hypothetical protein
MGFVIVRIVSGHYSQADNNHKPQLFLYSGWLKVACFGLGRSHHQASKTQKRLLSKLHKNIRPMHRILHYNKWGFPALVIIYLHKFTQYTVRI